jgi:hypothetical protein
MKDLKEFFKEPFIDHVYSIVKMEADGLDAIYKDFIIRQVGVFGLNALIEHKLLESCGIVNGRQLYTLVDRK